MKKKALCLVCSIIFVVSSCMIGHMIFTLKSVNDMANSKESQAIYYVLNPNVKDFSSFTAFSLNPQVDERIRNLEDVKKVYASTFLTFTNNDGSIYVNGKKMSNEHGTPISKMVILPYFEEDGFDKEMKKTFITFDLAGYFSCIEKESSNSTDYILYDTNLVLENISVPLIEENKISYTNERFEIKIDDLIENYYSEAFNTSFVILVPYEKFNQMVNHQSTFHVVYLDEKADTTQVLNQMSAISDELFMINGKESNSESFETIFKTDLPQFVIYGVLLLVGLFIFYQYLLNEEKALSYLLLGDIVFTIVLSPLVTWYGLALTIVVYGLCLVIHFMKKS